VKVSVVVPAFNEERLLDASLAAIRLAMRAFTERGWATELIVCDNNSTDHTAEIARAWDAAVVFEPVNQIARARNTGARFAKGEWLLFIDADCEPSRELFEDAAESIEADCLAAGATVEFPSGAAVGHLWLEAWNALSRLTRWGAGSFVLCDARAFRSVGGFSEAFYAGEEIDLFRRLKRLARRERREVVILHRHPIRTSDRKVRLYRASEHARFLLRTLFSAGRTLRRRDECFVWYDGRR
jgi:glycosyltransferase involved in cell wall biosynthesis